MKRLIILLLFSLLLMGQATNPFQEADDAYNRGQFSDALKLYQRIAVTGSDDDLRAQAWVRVAYIQFTLEKKRDAVTSLENALSLNNKIQVDPNIYPPNFATLFAIAQTRTQLLQGEIPLTSQLPRVSLPPINVPPPDISLPTLTLAPLSLPETTPFYVPLARNPSVIKRSIPTHMDIEGEMVVALTVDSGGQLQDMGVVFSMFPLHNKTLLGYARRKWKVIPGSKEGRPVPSVLAYRLTLRSTLKSIKTIRSNVRPLFAEDPIPTFLPETYTLKVQPIPPGSTFIGPEDLDIPGSVKKVKVNFGSMDTRGIFKGIALLSKRGRILQFRATEAALPAAIGAIREAMKTWTFTPARGKEGTVACYLQVELELLYSINAPKLERFERLNTTVLPR